MEAAFKNGYRHFDTAYSYKNENIVGKVIERWISRGIVKREDLFITTKLPMAGVHPIRVEMFLNKSLRNLGLDYVDLYLIDFPVCTKYDDTKDFPTNEDGDILTEDTDHVAVWKKMEEQVHFGKARAIGLSNFSKEQISRILENAEIKPATSQIESHLYFQNNELVHFCKEKGISVVAYSPLGSPGTSQKQKQMAELMSDEVIVDIAKKYSKSPAQIMLRFLIQRGFGVIPKSVNPSRIKENIDIFNFELDENDIAKLKQLNKGDVAKVNDRKELKGLSTHPEYPFK
ncbi:hypothetical protein HHI36_003551 [Cryptolaemus montrouzieri]|uniref:NADP-dependent oxidoreductase domain-containing protein n=1 Tax=Cryptolaemus montrouzieri TaxID=559131 RepID=A0ABD2PDW8_9CUCU